MMEGQRTEIKFVLPCKSLSYVLGIYMMHDVAFLTTYEWIDVSIILDLKVIIGMEYCLLVVNSTVDEI